ncbi:MAG: bifunctional 5,10-methylenetetrahydrofolate dehydrogenase/5,10-methenyltetrahydrofolate cyclohydrolase [Patescibacteria group bacterium]|nr:bifunctional 5,10-methylenetetrahydrofolate dehydrogenase/5,10-methenyltetrahydrofolate cyclohydrolase [Patescibacteria group bacterium]
MVINGDELAKEILVRLKEKVNDRKHLRLAAFLIDSNQEKEKFLKIKKKYCQDLGVDFRLYPIDPSLGRKKIRTLINQVVRSKLVSGALIQLPLPKNLSTQYFLNSIPARKDVDCLSGRCLGQFFVNQAVIRPPVVEVVDFIREKFKLDFESKLVVVVGYGRLVGRPLAHYFGQAKSTVIIINEKTKNAGEFFEKADVIIGGAGQPNLVKTCAPGAVLIDFGYGLDDQGRVGGDIDFEKLKNRASLITATPNGTGPILVAKLMENLVKLSLFKPKQND